MQFIPKGPDIPEKLLLEHEEGKVVFFCGAGISYPAELPLFRRLVEMLYENLNVEMRPQEKSTFDSSLYDTTIGLLEQNLIDGRHMVRTEIFNILQPNYSKRGALSTHKALLTLARDRNDRVRLVTTNQDRIFEKVISEKSGFNTCQAPFLPVPKKNWNSLVYLHGLLDETLNENNLDSLIFSSGDFGLAYLTERWASRFVSELFKNYTICFVGYRIGDPVLRYMMDALAADKSRGEETPDHYAFGDFSDGEYEEAKNEWEAKNVIPILYKKTKSHSYLHRTLRKWADTYRDGLLGKESIVIENALGNPLACTLDDDFVGRTLWALTDRSGLPAKRFSEMNPSIDWVEVFSNNLFTEEHLRLFGIYPSLLTENGLKFSIFNRPTDYTLSPWMTLLFGANKYGTSWDAIMNHMANWICNNLGKKKLISWVVKSGGVLHPLLAMRIKDKLEKDAGLLDSYKSVWRVISYGHTTNQAMRISFWDNRGALNANASFPLFRLLLRQLFAPKVVFHEPFRYTLGDSSKENDDTSIKSIVDWKIVLSVEYPRDFFKDMITDEQWSVFLPLLTSDFTSLIEDALGLMKELGEANEFYDRTFSYRPSIEKHRNNRDFDEWTILIDYLCDSWLAKVQSSPELAKSEVYRWQQIKYPLFRRLMFFAATKTDLFDPKSALNWLLSDDGFWLWSADTKHEIILLIRKIAPSLKSHDKYSLERAIMKGPPRNIFIEETTDEEFERMRSYYIWLRLTKYVSSGVNQSKNLTKKLAQIHRQNPDLRESSDESDEFVVYSGGGEIKRKLISSPKDCDELTLWLLDESDINPFKERFYQTDDWAERCRNDFGTASRALIESSKIKWVIPRWTKALDTWADSTLIEKAWNDISGILVNIPDEVAKEIIRPLSWWLRSATKNHVAETKTLLEISRHLISLFEDDKFSHRLIDTEFVTAALNHPVGQITDALLIWWYDQKPQDNTALPNEIKSIFTQLSDISTISYFSARIYFAQHVIPLLRVDPVWTKKCVIPLFKWGKFTHEESLAAWSAFLWAPRRYDPLLELIKNPFLKTSEYYDELKESGKQYASFLTFIALDSRSLFTKSQLARVTQQLPADGLQEVVYFLMRMVDGAGEQQSDFFVNRIKPYFKTIWPKERKYLTIKISHTLAELCVRFKTDFPEALELLLPYLRSIESGTALINPLKNSGLCSKYPKDALKFLGKTINDNTDFTHYLNDCLNQIKNADKSLAKSRIYRRLRSYCT